jgi:hypothetical protein
VWEKGQLLVVSAKALAQAQSSYGKAVSPAELCEIGGTCSICQVSGHVAALSDEHAQMLTCATLPNRCMLMSCQQSARETVCGNCRKRSPGR